MRPFELLCALVATGLGRRPVAPDLVAAVASADVPWPRLVTLSGTHLLTPALAPALADRALRDAVPDELRQYLAAMHEAAMLRNQALRAQLEHVAGLLNAIGIVPMALKGAIRLVDGLWPDPALRFMHDIDLLVPADAVAICASQLAASGWQPSPDGSHEAEHHLSLHHPEAPARIELHRLPLAGPHDRLLPAPQMLARAEPVGLGGAVVAVPAWEDQLVHLVAHGMLQHAFLESGRFLLRDLVEQTLLTARAGTDELRFAGDRFVATSNQLAWDVSRELCARCLGDEPSGATPTCRLIAARMMLQQRSPVAMQVLGPAGWLAARLCGVASACSVPGRFGDLVAQLAVFRHKTRW